MASEVGVLPVDNKTIISKGRLQPGKMFLIDFEQGKEYIAGLILLGIAPCTAMVFVWSQLTKGEPNYTLVQVSINDIIMVFAFAPLALIDCKSL